MREDRVTMGLGRSPAHQRWLSIVICFFLALAVWAVFGQTRRYAFVNYDDQVYVYENPTVTQGLNWSGVGWAFTHSVCANWHPLTTLSHMLDCQLWGVNPGNHHLTNVLLHAATAILLFLVLWKMTGVFWPSAFVAAVFAIHPLRAESVAWVAERKDVLSGFFFMLTLWAYGRYVQLSQVQSPKCKIWYGMALLLYALGLMSKPMLVTLPFVLLLLDYWPLGRFQTPQSILHGPLSPARKSQIANLSLEKLPFLLLTAASCVATVLAQKNAIRAVQGIDFPSRIGNALMSYTAYLGQMLYPAGLAPFYPHPGSHLPAWRVGLSALLLLFISVGVMAGRRKHPYLLVGWLWYLGMLVPVIGLIQVGAQARADRYTYLPQIGLYLLLTWLAADLCVGWRRRRMLLGGFSTVVLVSLILCAHAQTSYWRDSKSLWTHALACTSNNGQAHYNLGVALKEEGSVGEAIAHYRKALQIRPNFASAHINLGDALLQEADVDEAIAHFQKALQIQPDSAEAQNDLAWVLAACPQASLRNGSKALELAQRANQLTLNGNPAILSTLAAAYAEAGRFPEAMETAQRALQLADSQVNTKLARELRSQMKLYRAGLPFRFQ